MWVVEFWLLMFSSLLPYTELMKNIHKGNIQTEQILFMDLENTHIHA